MAITPGTRFEILSLLGAGGMGEVWRARDDRYVYDVSADGQKFLVNWKTLRRGH